MKKSRQSRQGKRLRMTFVGFLLFLAPVAVTVVCTIFVYDCVSEASGGNGGLIAAVLAVIIVALAAVCSAIDYCRRRLTVDKSVGEILAATERIATGDFSVRLSPAHAYGNYDDYDEIKENLNKMAAELSRSEVMNRDFVANVSHELKTPLAVIRNYAAALRDRRLPEDVRAGYADELVAASARLSDLVANILRLNKLEHQEILPEAEKTALGELLRQCVLMFEEKAEAKNIGLECDIDDVTAYTSPGYIEIIFNNLLSNALKFTDGGGHVSVTLKSRGDKAVVSVADTGCGIAPETGARIFDKFYQGDTSHAGEGNGLGLALVKRIIDMLGGEITVESVVGQGSTFTVVLSAEQTPTDR